MMFEETIGQLHTELELRNEGYVQRFETGLSQVIASNDSACIGPLLLLLDDEEEHDELMFSIVHAIERFDDATYVRAIIGSLHLLVEQAPRWGTVLHMRILNSPSAMSEYGEVVKSLPPEQREGVRKILESVRRRNSKFEALCNAILSSL